MSDIKHARWIEVADGDLGQRSVRGGLVTLLAQGGKFVLTLGSTAVLARLLAPEAFGLVAMVAAVTGFVLVIKDLGLSTATVQRTAIRHDQVSALFWINVCVSLLLALVTAAAAPLVAWFYDEPRLAWITAALAASFVFGGLTQQHQALLRRQMRFGPLALVELGSLATGIAVAVAGAWAGWGVWALVAREVATALANAIFVFVACGWRPSLPRRTAGLGELVRFGGNLTGANLVNYLARNLDNVLIGRFVGAGALGVYSRAYNLLMQPLVQINQPLSSVAVPALSRIADDPPRLRRVFLQLLEAVALVTIPAVGFLVAAADDVVLLVLGPGWEEAGRIFAVLGLVGLVQPVSNATSWLLVAQGRGAELLKVGAVNGSLSILSFVAGLRWGAFGVAASYAISGLLVRTPILFWYTGRVGPVRGGELAGVLFAPGLAALAAMAAVHGTRAALPLEPLPAVLACGAAAALAALATMALLPGGRRGLGHLRTLAGTLRGASPRAAGAPSA
ncbi:lipopolysaccharide biosynthesis protein [Vulgatibacter sp.]|uniref:lipopolysaccharide biosynthesis protein n=1 Tax=Vulgatibacter sp. TaxID=1971226 RepID=UPI003565AFD6